MPRDDLGCCRLDRIPVRPIGWLWQDGRSFWQWSDPALPHDADRCQ